MKLVVAVSIAFIMLFGVTGCGSDEITQLETEITQLQTRVDALEEQAKSRVTNLKLDPNSTISSSENDELRSLENEFDDQTDDDVQFQSRSKNAAPGIDASDAPSKADCDRRSDLLLDLLNRLDRPDLLDRRSLLRRSEIDELLDDLELLDLDRGYLDRVYDKLLDDLELIDDLDPRIESDVDQCVPDELDPCLPAEDGDDCWIEDDVDGG